MQARIVFSVAILSTLAVSTASADSSKENAAAPGAKDEPTKPPRLDAPEMPYRYQQPYPFVTPAWFLTQLIPSPEIAVGEDASTNETKAAFGLRWQLTPVLWSWGVHRRISRWRFLVVDPLARMSGSLALESTFEYIGGHVDRVLARPGLKATFPLLHRGEYLAFSMGTSVYAYDSSPHVAHDLGIYTFYGMLGLNGTYAPDHKIMSTLFTLRIRYF